MSSPASLSRRLPVLAAVFALVIGFSPNALAAANPAERVIILSIDGARPDSLQQANVPVLRSLWQEGSRSWTAQALPTSITLPNHTSMVTGLTLEQHGISWNDRFRADRPLQHPTLFTLAQARGLRTAMFVAKTKLEQLAPTSGLHRGEFQVRPAATVARMAAEYYREHRPHALMVHFHEPDSAGHRHGWLTEEYMQSLAAVDAPIGTLVEAIKAAGDWETMLLIITADHGGTERRHGDDIPEHRTIPWIALGGAAKANTDLTVRIDTPDTGATAMFALGLELPEGIAGRPVVEALARPDGTAAEEAGALVPAATEAQAAGPLAGLGWTLLAAGALLLLLLAWRLTLRRAPVRARAR